MNIYYHPSSLQHLTGDHPESPDRIQAVLAALRAHGIGEEDMLRPQPVDLELLTEVHDPRYVSTIERVSAQGGGYWGLDTPISPHSYEAALIGAGAAVSATDSALGGTPAFSIARPPGHHALYASAMGFCLFNNVAVAAQRAIRQGLERVLIVDWDVHHGNGTQDYFYAREDVLFFSTHQYPFYPGTGALRETGSGPGAGYTVNVPLPPGVGDVGYMEVFTKVLVPLAQRYRPQLILISAGYDAHLRDPLGSMAVTVAGFQNMASVVRALSIQIPECESRVAAILEGGYDTQALAASVIATIGALSSTEPEPEFQFPAQERHGRRTPDISNIIAQVRRAHGLDK